MYPARAERLHRGPERTIVKGLDMTAFCRADGVDARDVTDRGGGAVGRPLRRVL